ncbi:hypothetical protein AAZX31_06G109700 [Glycine max]
MADKNSRSDASCGHCKKLAPEYKKVASILSSHDPPIVLAKGYPRIKILRNGGKNVQEYKGTHEADGIVDYLKKQSGCSVSKFSGEEFDNFTAEKLRADYDLGHTMNAKHLPRGESSVTGPIVRLFNPFDEFFVDFQLDFHVEALGNFVEESSAESFKSKYRETAEQYRQQGLSFLVRDVKSTKGSFQYFGVKEDQVPLITVTRNDGKKFLKPNLEPDHMSTWLKAYKEGNIAPYFKSEPIPEANNEPVKVVVGDSLQDIVFNSGKNVLLEFSSPWCGYCIELAPILEEVAVSYQSDADVTIAKLDGVANDIPRETFEVRGYPTVYFRSASGKISQYDGNRTKEDIIEFIEKNQDKPAQQGKDELEKG